MTEEETVAVQDLYLIDDLTCGESDFIEELSSYEDERVLTELQATWLADLNIKYL